MSPHDAMRAALAEIARLTEVEYAGMDPKIKLIHAMATDALRGVIHAGVRPLGRCMCATPIVGAHDVDCPAAPSITQG